MGSRAKEFYSVGSRLRSFLLDANKDISLNQLRSVANDLIPCCDARDALISIIGSRDFLVLAKCCNDSVIGEIKKISFIADLYRLHTVAVVGPIEWILSGLFAECSDLGDSSPCVSLRDKQSPPEVNASVSLGHLVLNEGGRNRKLPFLVFGLSLLACLGMGGLLMRDGFDYSKERVISLPNDTGLAGNVFAEFVYFGGKHSCESHIGNYQKSLPVYEKNVSNLLGGMDRRPNTVGSANGIAELSNILRNQKKNCGYYSKEDAVSLVSSWIVK